MIFRPLSCSCLPAHHSGWFQGIRAEPQGRGLLGTAAGFERVRRALSLEEVERAVEAAKQQEQIEKERRRGTRPKAGSGVR